LGGIPRRSEQSFSLNAKIVPPYKIRVAFEDPSKNLTENGERVYFSQNDRTKGHGDAAPGAAKLLLAPGGL
jgi:hypothetical protein